MRFKDDWEGWILQATKGAYFRVNLGDVGRSQPQLRQKRGRHQALQAAGRLEVRLSGTLDPSNQASGLKQHHAAHCTWSSTWVKPQWSTSVDQFSAIKWWYRAQDMSFRCFAWSCHTQKRRNMQLARPQVSKQSSRRSRDMELLSLVIQWDMMWNIHAHWDMK